MWLTFGHKRAVAALERAWKSGRLAHAYLLVGPRQVGKMTLALDLARMVNCLGQVQPCGDCAQCRRVTDRLHTDVQVLGVDLEDGQRRTAIGIDQIRQAQRDASLKPFEGRYRIFVIDGAEHLTEEAANSLLKVLEEPPEQVVIVLVASDAGTLLPTIVSRCHQIELRPLPVPELAHELESRRGLDPVDAERLARLSGGRVGWALEALSRPDLLELREEKLSIVERTVHGALEERLAYSAKLAGAFSTDRALALDELSLWLDWWRDALLVSEGVAELVTNRSRSEALTQVAQALPASLIGSAIGLVRQTMEDLERNVNPRLALDDLMLALPRP